MSAVRVLPALAALGVLAATAGCGPPPFNPGTSLRVEAGDSVDVEGVLFLVGDAGEATVEASPLVHRLRADVERWSARLPADSSVAVLFLGDNVYPAGVRDAGDPDFPVDSARLHAQVWAVAGPEARADGVPGIFLPGNHDWGGLRGAEGRARLANEARLLEREAARGPAVAMLPAPGTPGPRVVELGDAAALVLLDTEWWLRTEDPAERTSLLEALADTLARDRGRPVVLAAHHPWASGGPHTDRGLLDPFGLLARTGAIIQDRSSPPYQALLDGLGDVFARAGAPLVYAAGHDHSLQVIRGEAPRDPSWTLVSGAGSKLTGVTEVEGMEWADRAPGYMRVLFRSDGAVDLYVERAPDGYRLCGGDEGERAGCLRDGVAAFSTGFSVRLR